MSTKPWAIPGPLPVGLGYDFILVLSASQGSPVQVIFTGTCLPGQTLRFRW